MNRVTQVLGWIVLLGIGPIAAGPASSQTTPWEATAEKEAVAAAEAWLSLVDRGEYVQSWEAAASYFRTAVRLEKWAETMNGFRKPLGDVLERERTSARFADSLPGAPDGKYLVVQFRTSFRNKKSAVETVTPMLEENGAWRVSGYFIQ